MQGRRRGFFAALVAVGLLLALAGCGGSGSDAGSDGGSKSGDDSSADAGDTGESDGDSSDGDSSDDGGDEASGDLPDPCELVPLDTASEILGEPSAEPKGDDSQVGLASRSCTWQTQESIDAPSIDNAGHILTLTIIAAPNENMSVEELFEASEATATDEADIDGCDEAFWLSGMLSALQDGVYLNGSAGLADDSPEGKQATTDLVSAACSSL